MSEPNDSKPLPEKQAKQALPMSRLIALVGDDNIKFDNLRDSIVNITNVKGKHKLSRVTFITEGLDANEVYRWTTGDEKIVGLVLWLNRADVDRALATNKAEGEARHG